MAGEPPDFIRMDYDRRIDWNMEEQFSGDGVSSEKMRSAVTKWCSVGKNLFLTGLVISSAPLVLPPLAIVSAFGFAASIPYGVFLASYACTEKIMGAWLPIPSPPYFDPADETVEENGYREDIDEYIEEDEQTLSNEIRAEEGERPALEKEKIDEVLDDLVIDVVVVHGDEEEEEDQVDTGSGEAAAIEVTTVVFEGNGGEGILDYIADEEEEVKETKDFAEANGAVGNVREQMEIEREANEASWVGLMDEANSAALHPHADHETSEVSSNKPTNYEEAKLTSLTMIDVVESGDDVSSLTMIDVVKSEDNVSMLTIESKVEANTPCKDYNLPSNKESYNEVKIKEQIDSMKKILGFKDTTLESYIDEVNALYAFVGVEPPSPLRDSSDDLNQLNYKLQFLMSIVGVK